MMFTYFFKASISDHRKSPEWRKLNERRVI